MTTRLALMVSLLLGAACHAIPLQYEDTDDQSRAPIDMSVVDRDVADQSCYEVPGWTCKYALSCPWLCTDR